jgi:hypothetical protein
MPPPPPSHVRAGSMDDAIQRYVALHLRSLTPPLDVEIPPPVEAASAVALGLLYAVLAPPLPLTAQETANRFATKVLLKELSRPREGPREALFLAVGMALGWVLLGRGDAAGVSDLKIAETLAQWRGRGGMLSLLVTSWVGETRGRLL